MDTFSLFLNASSAHFISIFRLNGVLLYLPALLFLALLIEAIVVKDRSKTIIYKLKKNARLDWFFYFIYQLNISAVVGHIFTMFFAYALYKLLIAFLGTHTGFIDVRLAMIPVYFLVLDCLGYWYHRCSHRFSMLWSLHQVHHSIQDFNLIAAFRDHPALAAFSRVLIALPIVIIFNTLGMHPEISLAYALIVKLINMLQHSQITSDWGILGKVIVSPAAHRLHHSIAAEHYDRNFGGVFIIWDKIFGTYAEVLKGNVADIQIGLPGYESDQSILSSLLIPLKDSIAQISNSKSKSVN